MTRRWIGMTVLLLCACSGWILKPSVQNLRNSDPGKRQRAVDHLVENDGARVLDQIAEVLKDDLPEIRIDAIHCLSRLKDERAIPHLLNMENDKDKEVRHIAVLGLSTFGNRGRRELAELMSRGHKEDIRAYAAWTMGLMGDPVAFDELKELLLKERAPEIVRAGAARAIGCLKHTEAQDMLLKVVDDEGVPSTTRCGAAYGLIANYGFTQNDFAKDVMDRLRSTASTDMVQYCASRAFSELYEPSNIGVYCEPQSFVAAEMKVPRRDF